MGELYFPLIYSLMFCQRRAADVFSYFCLLVCFVSCNDLSSVEKVHYLRKWTSAQSNELTTRLDAAKMDDGNGFRLVASVPIANGTVLGSMPYSSTLSVFGVHHSHRPQLYEELFNMKGPEELPLMLLLVEEASAEFSFWRPYIDMLPAIPPICLYWDEALLASANRSFLTSLKAQSSIRSAAFQSFDIFRYFNRIFGWFSGSGFQFYREQFFDGPSFNWQSLMWAYSVIMTRAWGTTAG